TQATVAVPVADLFRNRLGRDCRRHVIDRPLVDRVGRLDRRVNRVAVAIATARPAAITIAIATARAAPGAITIAGTKAATAAAAARRSGADGEDQGRQRHGTGNKTHNNGHQDAPFLFASARKLLDDWGRGPRFIPARCRERKV